MERALEELVWRRPPAAANTAECRSSTTTPLSRLIISSPPATEDPRGRRTSAWRASATTASKGPISPGSIRTQKRSFHYSTRAATNGAGISVGTVPAWSARRPRVGQPSLRCGSTWTTGSLIARNSLTRAFSRLIDPLPANPPNLLPRKRGERQMIQATRARAAEWRVLISCQFFRPGRTTSAQSSLIPTKSASTQLASNQRIAYQSPRNRACTEHTL